MRFIGLSGRRVLAPVAAIYLWTVAVGLGLAQTAPPTPDGRAVGVGSAVSASGQAASGRAASVQAASVQAASVQAASGQAHSPLVQAHSATGQDSPSLGRAVAAAPRVPRFVVLLDAAHGGEDSGARLAGSTAERAVTLAVSVRLRSLLAARGLAVVTTREGNVDLSGDQRAQVANHANAAACVSLHASETGSGVHIFVSSLEPREQTRFLAWKTAQAAFVARSLRLASVVNSAFEHGVSGGGTDGTGGVETDSGGGAEAGQIPATLGRTALPGVDSMTCPAVAVELAPIRGADRKVTTEVTDERYQAQVADVLAAAILEWRTEWDAEFRPGGAGTGGVSGAGAAVNGDKRP